MLYKEINLKQTSVGKIPRDWEVIKLGDHSELIVPMRDKPKVFDGDIPWIRIEDIDGKYLWGSKSGRKVSKEIIENMHLKPYPIGTVLCSCSGEMGVCTITKSVLTSNQTFIGIVPSRNLDPEYVYFLLTHLKKRLQILGTGTTIPYLSRSKFEKFEVPLPYIEEQKAVVGVLGVVDSAIELVDRVIWKTERLKKGLMQTLLTKGIGHKEFKDTEIGRVPKEWQVTPLSDIVKVEKVDVNPQNFSNEFFELYSIPAYHEIHAPEIKRGREIRSIKVAILDDVVLFGKLNPRVPKIWLVRKKNAKQIASTEFIPLYPKKSEVSAKFLYYLCWSDYILPKTLQWVTGTTQSRLRVNEEALTNLRIPLPLSSEQQKIAEILSAVDQKLELEQKEKTSVMRVRRGLMDLLLTGKVRVKVD